MRQHYLSVLYLIAVSWLNLVGCELIPDKTAELPTWVSQPPADTSHFYATGSGVSLFEAKQNARLNMGAIILAEVSDKVDIVTTRDGQFEQDLFQQKSSIKVSDIPLKQAEIEQQQISGNLHYVLLSMHKTAFTSQLKSQSKATERKIKPVIQNIVQRNFDGWWALRQLLPDISDMERNLAILEGLNNTELTYQSKLIENYYSALAQSMRNRNLNLINNAGYPAFKDIVQQQLSDQRIGIHTRARGASSVRIEEAYTPKQLGRELHIDGRLTLLLLNQNGQVLAQKELAAKTVSLTSLRDGKQKLRGLLQRELASIDLITSFIKE